MAIAKASGMPVRMIDPVKVGIRAESAPAAWTGALEGAGQCQYGRSRRKQNSVMASSNRASEAG